MSNRNRYVVQPDTFVFWGTTILFSLSLFF